MPRPCRHSRYYVQAKATTADHIGGANHFITEATIGGSNKCIINTVVGEALAGGQSTEISIDVEKHFFSFVNTFISLVKKNEARISSEVSR